MKAESGKLNLYLEVDSWNSKAKVLLFGFSHWGLTTVNYNQSSKDCEDSGDFKKIYRILL